MNIKNYLFKFIAPIFLFLLFIIVYSYYLPKIPIRFWDENAWIGRSYFFDLFVRRDFSNPLWQSYYSYDQPKLAEYLYGLALYPSYIKEKTKHKNYDFIEFLIDNNFYQVQSKFYENYKDSKKNFVVWGRRPFEDFDVNSEYLINKYGSNFQNTVNLIFQARKINILFLATTVILIYFISLLSSNPFIAFFTSIIYGFSNLIVAFGLRAQSDGIFVFFYSLALLLLVLINKKKKFRLRLLLITLFAVTTALLSQTKLNGVLLLILFDLIFVIRTIIYFCKNKTEGIKKNLLILFLSNFIFIITFISIHPFLYDNPIKKIFILFQWRNTVALSQIKQFPNDYLSSYIDRVKQIFINFLYTKDPQIYNSILLPNGIFIFKNQVLIFINNILFIFGLLFLLYSLFKKRYSSSNIVLITFLFSIFAMSFFLYLNWERYLIQFVFFFIFIKIFAVGQLLILIEKYLSYYFNYIYRKKKLKI